MDMGVVEKGSIGCFMKIYNNTQKGSIHVQAKWLDAVVCARKFSVVNILVAIWVNYAFFFFGVAIMNISSW